MAIKYSTAVRNAKLNAVEETIGAAPILKLYSGAAPSDCATAATGTKLAEVTLPSDYMTTADDGEKSMLGSWPALTTYASGAVGYFRIYDATDSTCHMQGTVTVTGGGGDLTVADVNIIAGQYFTITAFTLTDAHE